MRISVIIPTLNEAKIICTTLARLSLDDQTEVLVVDGGSTDDTVSLVGPPARVIKTGRGRAHQQNVGAEAATGDVLLFLHADCVPAPTWTAAVRKAAIAPDFLVGSFRMKIESPRRLYRAIERAGDLRVRWFGLPYGDQGIFMRRDKFRQLGGFPHLPFMEDLMFMRMIRRLGRVTLLDQPIHISPRRWEQTGIVHQSLRNWALTFLAVGCGVTPDRLRRYYPTLR